MNTNDTRISGTGQLPCCPVCGNHLSLRIAKGRKSGKPFIMLICGQDGRHFRGFIGDRKYINLVLDKLENTNQVQLEG